ncbi:Ribosomal protein, mitochondrial, large subunit, putative, partial [Candida maltosa Xu316]
TQTMFRSIVRPVVVKPIIEQVRFYRYLTKPLPTVYEPLPKKITGKSVMQYVEEKLLSKYDPTGKRRALIRNNKEGLRSGDIIKVTYLDRSDVTGRIIAIKRSHNSIGSNILIRTKLNKVGSEVRIPVYNPNIRNIEVLEKPEKYLPRTKQYYIRETSRLDVDDVEAYIKRKTGEQQKTKHAKK